MLSAQQKRETLESRDLMAANFLSELLDEYGQASDRFVGSGQLESEHGIASVEWAAAQYPDGQVLLACQGGADAFDVFMSSPTGFVGEASDGTKLDCNKYLGELPLLRHVPQGQTGGWAVYRLSLLHADLPASGPPGLVRHLLTNFEFDISGRHEAVTFQLPGVQGDVRLVPAPGDPMAPNRLRALRAARPTAWLEIEPQDGHAVRARAIADNICYLLSIARGTKVAWIQEEVVSADGVPTHRFYSNRITKPYSPYAPLDPVRIGGTLEFLAATYSAYCDRCERYRLAHGTIDSVLDAKVETDFLETRGAKLAVALEVLKQNVLLASEPDKAFHVNPEVFAVTLDDIAEAARSVLMKHGVTREAATRMSASQRFFSLNRRSFSYLLRQVCRRIELNLERRDLDLFVRCRNSLVHRGEFYCATASEEERDQVPPKATKFEEYLFLISVVDAFLLRLVDYTGPYLVRIGGSEWAKRTV